MLQLLNGNKTYPVRLHGANISGASGCCGIGTISRLSAESRISTMMTVDEIIQSQRNKIKAHIDGGHYSIYGYLTKLPNYKEKLLCGDMALSRACSTFYAGPDFASTKMGSNCSAPVLKPVMPEEVGYAAVLQQLRDSYKYSIYYMSDNMDELGDVRLGPFNTRTFHTWLYLNNLIGSATTGPTQSLTTGRTLQAWVITPNWRECTKIIHEAVKTFIHIVGSINEYEGIKQQREAEIATEQRKLREIIDIAVDW